MRRGAVAFALLAGLAAGGCAQLTGDDRPERARPPSFSPLGGAPAFPRSGVDGPIPGKGAPAAYLWRSVWLHTEPGGRRLVRIPVRTEFRSLRVLSVVEQEGPWVGVIAAELRNGQVGWLDARRFTRLYRIPYEIEIDRSARRMIVRQGGREIARTPVAVGRPASPTPTGRFAVSDKLLTGNPGGPYGCCILALTAHQPRAPQGWTGGDRVAIHSTPSEETIGQEASAGCIRAPTALMRRLVRQIPLGTPVQVRA